MSTRLQLSILMTTRRTSTKGFKLDAVRLASDSGNESSIVRNLGIAASALGRRKKQYEVEKDRAFPGRGNPWENPSGAG